MEEPATGDPRNSGDGVQHVHVEAALLHGAVASRAVVTQLLGRAPSTPTRVLTGCGLDRPLAATSAIPERVTCWACRQHAAGVHQRTGEQWHRRPVLVRTQDAVSRWRAAGEAGDAGAAADVLSADVELVSPLTEQFRFHGREQVHELLAVAFSVVEGIRFHTHVDGDDTHALFYRARIGSQPLEEAQLLRLDEQGRIQQVTLFIRSLPALTGLMSALGPALARRQGRRGLATLLTLSTAPLHGMSRFSASRVVPLASPRR